MTVRAQVPRFHAMMKQVMSTTNARPTVMVSREVVKKKRPHEVPMMRRKKRTSVLHHLQRLLAATSSVLAWDSSSYGRKRTRRSRAGVVGIMAARFFLVSRVVTKMVRGGTHPLDAFDVLAEGIILGLVASHMIIEPLTQALARAVMPNLFVSSQSS